MELYASTTTDGKIDPEAFTDHDEGTYEAEVVFDTAIPISWRESEPLVGEFLSGLDRSACYVATNFPNESVHSVDDAKRIFNRLQREATTDLYRLLLIHAIDEAVTWMVDGISYLSGREQKKGRIKHLGFSFRLIYEDFEYITRFRPEVSSRSNTTILTQKSRLEIRV